MGRREYILLICFMLALVQASSSVRDTDFNLTMVCADCPHFLVLVKRERSLTFKGDGTLLVAWTCHIQAYLNCKKRQGIDGHRNKAPLHWLQDYTTIAASR